MHEVVEKEAINASLNSLKSTFATQITFDYEWRCKQLDALLQMLLDNEAEICAALKQDLNKSYTEAFVTEVGYLRGEVKHARKHLKKWMKPRSVSTPMVALPGKSFHQPEPLGVVLIMGAWNFPFQLTIAPLIAALAAGNCAIVKPPELTLHVSNLIAKLVPQYLDSNAVSVVEGGKEVSSYLLSLQFDHIFYTGGENVAKIVMQAAAKHLTPVTLELGGKSPCIVDKDTNLDVTAKRIAWGKWTNAGQICIAPDYVLVHESIQQTFLEALKKALTQQFGEDPSTSDDYGRIVNSHHTARLASLLEEQPNIVVGGEVDIESRYVAPTIILEPEQDSKVMREEIFGPILPVLTFKSHEQVTSIIKSRAKPLALYLFTNNKSLQQKYINQSTSGNMCVNDTLIFMTNADLAFGGVGNSGMGRYHGQSGFDLLSNLKAVMTRPFILDAFVRYPPFNKFKLNFFKMMQ